MEASSIRSIAVLGAGTMGNGIAHVAATAGYQVLLFDAGAGRAEKGLQTIRANLAKGVEKGKITAADSEAAIARIRCVDSIGACGEAQLAIEAVPENLELKVRVLGDLAKAMAPGAILASNTSGLCLTEIAAALPDPGRVVGMHFFNPVHVMKLLEVVRAHQTSEETLQAVREVGARMGKEVIVVRDVPGFASSRLGIALGMEAIRMLEEGVATAAEIDKAMKLGYGHPMGPLELTDLVGLDVRMAIGEYLYRELGGAQFRPPQLLKRLVRAGKLGRKTGEGFFKY
ncbi:MAG TPA: 3-hydroxyacyl-CoA dehydrogenase family protein [Vulgatibacter sp.]